MLTTIKLPYKTSNPTHLSIIHNYQHHYSNYLHFIFNRSLENLTEKQLRTLNPLHIDLLDSWFKQSAIKEALQLKASLRNKPNAKLIFGGRKLYLRRNKKLITKKEYLEKRLSPIYSIGESCNPSIRGNRKFHIENDLKSILFKPNTKTHINLLLPKLRPNIHKTLSKLFNLQNHKAIAITYKLNQHHIYISFDNQKLIDQPIKQHIINNRIMALDLNPNYIGVSIVDWVGEMGFRVIYRSVISIKDLNDIEYGFKGLSSEARERVYLGNKRRYEIIEVAKRLVGLGIRYGVEVFGVEGLSIKIGDKGKGRSYNRLVNNRWLRNLLVYNIEKRCQAHGIIFQEVKPEYTSFLGNILYRELKLPDMVLSSIEVGRRAYEFNLQYIKKVKDKKKNIVFPDWDLVKSLVHKLLEEFSIKERFKSLKELYLYAKNSKLKYRVSLDIKEFKVFKQNSSHKSLLVNYVYG